MGVIDSVREWVLRWLMPGEFMDTARRDRLEKMQLQYEYYQGNQRRFIKAKAGQADDNIVVNFSGLVVERSLSLLLGGGVGFDLPGDKDGPIQLYIDDVWAANKKDILLHKAGQGAGWSGTGYLKIIPDGLVLQDRVLPRLVALDPRWMEIETQPEDVDIVTAYVTRYNITRDGQEVARKEVISRAVQGVDEAPADVWVIRNYEANRSGLWQQLGEDTVWPYDFPPIIHWQNLPEPGSPYGQSDIADVMELQDRINFVASNISRIIRYHAHPRTWSRGTMSGKSQSWGADEMLQFTTDDAMVANLEMSSDLASSARYLMDLRQSMFDISRTIDITSMADKLGSLTNFGLRVLFFDALAKLRTKQALMGEALEETNRRLLILANAPDIDPGTILWPDNLPQSEFEALQAAQIEIDAGLVSKQTIAGERGRDWELEMERMAEEQAQGDNVGAALLRAFNAGA